jgi:hypothetical protein
MEEADPERGASAETRGEVGMADGVIGWPGRGGLRRPDSSPSFVTGTSRVFGGVLFSVTRVFVEVSWSLT